MATEKVLRAMPGNWLKQYLGIKEGSTEHKEILAVLNNSKLCTRYTMTVNDAWCATAVSAAFIACGLTDIFPCVECSCANMITLAKNNGIWEEDDSYTPEIGDVMLYDWQDSGSGDNTGNPDHVGIVTAVSGTAITVLEGNKSDTVGYRSMKVNGKYIRGYILPDYESLASSKNDSDSNSDTASGTSSAKASDESATTKKATKPAKSGPDSSIAGTYVVTATSGLNVRNGAGIGYSKMVTIPKGTKVKCYGYYTAVGSVKWLYVQFTYNGIEYTGHASGEWLEKQ